MSIEKWGAFDESGFSTIEMQGFAFICLALNRPRAYFDVRIRCIGGRMNRETFIFVAMFFVCWCLFSGCQSTQMTSARVYIQQKDYPAALVQLKEEIKLRPTNAEAYFLAGQIYGELDSLDQMIAMFAKAEELNLQYKSDIKKWRESKSAEAFNKGLKVWEKKKDVDEAIRWTELSARINPENVNAWKNLGFLYQQKEKQLIEDGKITESTEFAKKIVEARKKAFSLAPKDAESAWLLAGLYIKNGMNDSALAIIAPFESGEGIDSALYANVLLAFADIYDNKGEKEKALEYLKRAEKIKPKDAGLLFDIGVRLYTMEKFSEAADYFLKVVDIQPENNDAGYNLSLSLFNAKKYSEAEIVNTELLSRDPLNPEYWDQMALIWAAMGKAKEAKTAEKISKLAQEGKQDEVAKLAEEVGVKIKK